MRVRLASVAAVAAASALLLAGCSESVEGSASAAAPGSATSSAADPEQAEQTGPELVRAAAQALRAAGSVHVTGTASVEGGTTELDLQLQGEDTAGTITLAGTTVQLVITDGSAYVQASADFWISSGVPEDTVALLADRWVLMPTEAGLTDGELSLAGFLDNLEDPTGTIDDEVGTDELDGQAVWVVTGTDTDGGIGTLYIAADGEPYPLLESSGGSEPSTAEFSGFGELQPIEAPVDYLDLGDLGI